MSAFLPSSGRGPEAASDHPTLQDRDLDREERRARWVVRAAQWRAVALAEAVFGSVGQSLLRGMRSSGPARGIMVLHVPFDSLESHREREARFMDAAASDPVLSEVPLVYVFGPDQGRVPARPPATRRSGGPTPRLDHPVRPPTVSGESP